MARLRGCCTYNTMDRHDYEPHLCAVSDPNALDDFSIDWLHLDAAPFNRSLELSLFDNAATDLHSAGGFVADASIQDTSGQVLQAAPQAFHLLQEDVAPPLAHCAIQPNGPEDPIWKQHERAI